MYISLIVVLLIAKKSPTVLIPAEFNRTASASFMPKSLHAGIRSFAKKSSRLLLSAAIGVTIPGMGGWACWFLFRRIFFRNRFHSGNIFGPSCRPPNLDMILLTVENRKPTELNTLSQRLSVDRGKLPCSCMIMCND